ncbi:MAG: hypothetical protein K2Y05_01210 [Hyphomicrobiaceae bacterium]|nr:hypothetical protein [Hyphomicrobiaceae bacterium]
MADSDEFLGVLRKARAAGKRDILDTPDYIAKHKARLLKLHKSDSEEDTDITTAAAAWIDALVERDLLSSREEFLDKAIAAYVEKYGVDHLPGADKSIVDAARDEIEGKTQGAFASGFVATLASAARAEFAAETEKSRGQERDGRE